ncbi:MAG: hypothetical protein ABJB74_12035 [Gemmatimonas sp.]
MNEHPRAPDEQAQIDVLEVELVQQLERVGVDLMGVGARLSESQPRVERMISDDEFEVALTIDVSAILDTLRSLPDAAGTDAFVAAYNARRI